MSKPDYDTTVARIAGNIASGIARDVHLPEGCTGVDLEAVERTAHVAVALARAIVAEVKRTQPEPREPR